MPSDFRLVADELQREQAGSAQTSRHVSSGLAPTAAVPTTRRPQKAPPTPCYAPCAACGVEVLTGSTLDGTRVMLDTRRTTYTVLWLPDTSMPQVAQSRAYPVHECIRQSNKRMEPPGEQP